MSPSLSHFSTLLSNYYFEVNEGTRYALLKYCIYAQLRWSNTYNWKVFIKKNDNKWTQHNTTLHRKYNTVVDAVFQLVYVLSDLCTQIEFSTTFRISWSRLCSDSFFILSSPHIPSRGTMEILLGTLYGKEQKYVRQILIPLGYIHAGVILKPNISTTKVHTKSFFQACTQQVPTLLSTKSIKYLPTWVCFVSYYYNDLVWDQS